MARTQAADYDQRRQAIVEQAAKLYAAHGFLGASVVDLAKACDMSKSLIYHYYASKEDILFDAMDSHIQTLTKAAETVLAAGGDAEHRLRGVARALMTLYAGAAARHKVLLNELDNLPQDQRTIIIEHQRNLVRIIENLVLEIRPDLTRRKNILRPITMLFFGMINWTHTWFDPSGPAPAATVADLAVDVLLNGVKSLA